MAIIRMPSASLQVSRSVTAPTWLRCWPTLFYAGILGVLERCRPSVTLPCHRWVRGKIAINLDEGDALVDVALTDGASDVLLFELPA